MIDIAELKRKNGLTRSPSETAKGSIDVYKKGNYKIDGKRNRLNSGILRTQYIILEDPIEGDILDNNVFTGIELLHRNQYVLVRQKENDDLWRVYQGGTIGTTQSKPILIRESVSMDDFFEHYAEAGSMEGEQCIYYGAPGTGKSYFINSKVSLRTLLEKDFKFFLEADPALNEKSVESYCTYYKMFETRTGESFFDYADPLVFLEWREKYNEDWDTKYWVPVLNKYIDFLQTRLYRTTFHPDYDYAQFVGSFKPTSKTGPITYEFTPQVFSNAYISSWKCWYAAQKASTSAIQVYLVIEEINRGNCAQIFGDIFQLLDRDEKGFSRYMVNADEDFAQYIENIFTDSELRKYYIDIVGKGKLRLPPNLHILATMNTSDQSLFPMDSAFKRRFDWEYVPIKYKKDDTCGAEWNADQFVISVGDSCYHWLDFLEKVNKNVYKVTKSEDKQMGEFFIKHSVDYKEFRSKVLFYLWDSVYKDEEGNKDAEKVFHFKLDGEDDKTLTFQSLFEGNDDIQKKRIKEIMSKLEVQDQSSPSQQGEQEANGATTDTAPAEGENPAQ